MLCQPNCAAAPVSVVNKNAQKYYMLVNVGTVLLCPSVYTPQVILQEQNGKI